MKKNTISVIILLFFTVLIICGAFVVLGRGGGFYNTVNGGFEFNAGTEERSDYSGGSAELDADSIDELELKWPVGEINIVTYSGNRIIFTETSGKEIDVKNQLKYIVRDGKLEINYSSKHMGVLDFVDGGFEKNIEIKIPQSTSLIEKIEIDTVSSKLQVAVEKIKELNINTVSGDVAVEGGYENLEYEGVSGNLDMKLSEAPKTIDAETVSGEIKLAIPENEGFEADYDLVSGDFKCEFPVTPSKNHVVYKKPASSFEFESVSGDISIVK